MCHTFIRRLLVKKLTVTSSLGVKLRECTYHVRRPSAKCAIEVGYKHFFMRKTCVYDRRTEEFEKFAKTHLAFCECVQIQKKTRTLQCLPQ